MDDQAVLQAVRQRGWRMTLTEQAKRDAGRHGVSKDDIRRVLVTAKAVRAEGDGWRVLGGTDGHGLALEPLIAGNGGGILVLEL